MAEEITVVGHCYPGCDITLVAVICAPVSILTAYKQLDHMIPDWAVCIQSACTDTRSAELPLEFIGPLHVIFASCLGGGLQLGLTDLGSST